MWLLRSVMLCCDMFCCAMSGCVMLSSDVSCHDLGINLARPHVMLYYVL